MTDTLLPPSATPFERAAELAVGNRVDAIQTDGIRTIGDALVCPSDFLPFLAWARSVDTYLPGWPEETKRNVISNALKLHRFKGTREAVIQAVASFGFGGTVEERVGRKKYNGEITHNGMYRYGSVNGWAKYRIVMKEPVRNNDIAPLLALLELIAPKRCELVGVDFRDSLHLYNGDTIYNGGFNHGTVTING